MNELEKYVAKKKLASALMEKEAFIGAAARFGMKAIKGARRLFRSRKPPTKMVSGTGPIKQDAAKIVMPKQAVKIRKPGAGIGGTQEPGTFDGAAKALAGKGKGVPSYGPAMKAQLNAMSKQRSPLRSKAGRQMMKKMP